MRVAAVQTLGALPSNDGAAALAKLLGDGSPAVRVEAALSLGQLAQRKSDQPGAAPALAALEAAFTGKDGDLGDAPGRRVGAGGDTTRARHG